MYWWDFCPIFFRFSNYCLHSFNSPYDLEQNGCTHKKTQLYICCKTNHTQKRWEIEKRRKPLILQYRVVYMHISWFIHISHTIVRTLRPEPLQKGLSSKASEKITHRLKVCSRAATRLHHVPKARSSTIMHSFSSQTGHGRVPGTLALEVFET